MARKLPSLNALRAFEAAARYGRFSEAAQELNVTHAAISRHVRELEQYFGRALFRRVHRGLILTEEGARYRKILTKAFDMMAAATADMQSKSGGATVTLSVDTGFAARWLVPRLGDFIQSFPNIDLNIISTPAYADFRAEAVDLGVRFGNGDWEDLTIDHLIDIYSYPVCSPDFKGLDKIKTAEDLLKTPLLHEENKSWWAAWFVAAGIPAPESLRGPVFQDLTLAVDAAERGQGIALADAITAFDSVQAGKLVIPISVYVPCEAYYLVGPPTPPSNSAVADFKDWLLGKMKNFQSEAIPSPEDIAAL